MRQSPGVVGVTVVRLANHLVHSESSHSAGWAARSRWWSRSAPRKHRAACTARCWPRVRAPTCESLVGSARSASLFRGCCGGTATTTPDAQRPVCRVHQPDDAVVHITGQFRRQMRAALPVAESWELRHWGRPSPDLLADPSTARPGHVNPGVSISLWEMRPRRCAGDRSPDWSAKGSPCTGRIPARRPSRDTCR